MEVVRRLNCDCSDFDRRRALAFEVYARNLVLELRERPARQLSGADLAVREAKSMFGCAVGLLTGSTEATARIKLESAGLAFDQFTCNAFSEDGELREALPPAARARFAQLFGHPPNTVILIGDTPRDIQAALATGCEFIGVTTGPYGRSALEQAGARLILNALSDMHSFRAAIRTALGQT
jgi:phosphoglycolate phosphatase-like HAD superfamily hydrolase